MGACINRAFLPGKAARPGAKVPTEEVSTAITIGEIGEMFNDCTMTYFDAAGRGEVLRLALSHLGVAWTDVRIKGADWPALKPTTTWQSIPVVNLANGTQLAQTKAILRLIGKHGNFYPTDPTLAFRADELVDTIEDLSVTTRMTGDGKEQAEKEAARKDSAERGAIHEILRRIDEFIGTHGSSGYCIGHSLSTADFAVFSTCSNIVSNYDGIPSTALDPFVRIQAVRKTVASLPSTIKWYESRGDKKSKSELFNAAAKEL